MPSPQQHEVLFPGNLSHAADAPQSATAFPAPSRYLQSAPAPHPRPVLGQPHGHVGVQRDAVFPSVNAPADRRSNEGMENIPPQAVENLAAQAQPQNLQYNDMGYYDIADNYPPSPPHGHGNHLICDNARIAQDIPTQAQVAPPAPVTAIDIFNDEVQQAAAGPARAFFDEVPRGGPVPNSRRATEVLRQLALLYLNDPNSQIRMIRMEPGYGDEVTVVIALKLTDL